MDRDFKGVWIPRAIWLDERLTALDKIIFTEIDSLDIGDEGCYATNEHFAEFCQCTERKVTQTISKLKSLGLIEQTGCNGRVRILKSNLEKSSRQTGKKFGADPKKVPGRVELFSEHSLFKNNTMSNTLREGEHTPALTLGEYGHVTMTEEQHRTLCETYGQELAGEYITRVDEYCEQTGKRYKNYYLTVRNWLRRDGRGELTELAKEVQGQTREPGEIPF